MEVLPRFDAMCAQRIVVGHDVGFDLAVLTRVRRRSPERVFPPFDTRRLAQALGYRDTRLERVASHLKVSIDGRHTAVGDARMAGEILLALIPTLRSRGVRTLGELEYFQRTAPPHD